MANALPENEKPSRNENNQPMFCFTSLIFFLTPDFFLGRWEVFGLSGENLVLRRNQEPKPEAHLLFYPSPS